MSTRAVRTSTLILAFLMASSAVAGVVSNYRINGKTVHEGATFEEFRAVAGDPAAVEPVDGNERYVEWVYQCEGAGAGRCEVADGDGQREMRARFSLGRLKRVSFERL